MIFMKKLSFFLFLIVMIQINMISLVNAEQNTIIYGNYEQKDEFIQTTEVEQYKRAARNAQINFESNQPLTTDNLADFYPNKFGGGDSCYIIENFDYEKKWGSLATYTTRQLQVGHSGGGGSFIMVFPFNNNISLSTLRIDLLSTMNFKAHYTYLYNYPSYNGYFVYSNLDDRTLRLYSMPDNTLLYIDYTFFPSDISNLTKYYSMEYHLGYDYNKIWIDIYCYNIDNINTFWDTKYIACNDTIINEFDFQYFNKDGINLIQSIDSNYDIYLFKTTNYTSKFNIDYYNGAGIDTFYIVDQSSNSITNYLTNLVQYSDKLYYYKKCNWNKTLYYGSIGYTTSMNSVYLDSNTIKKFKNNFDIRLSTIFDYNVNFSITLYNKIYSVEFNSSNMYQLLIKENNVVLYSLPIFNSNAQLLQMRLTLYNKVFTIAVEHNYSIYAYSVYSSAFRLTELKFNALSEFSNFLLMQFEIKLNTKPTSLNYQIYELSDIKQSFLNSTYEFVCYDEFNFNHQIVIPSFDNIPILVNIYKDMYIQSIEIAYMKIDFNINVSDNNVFYVITDNINEFLLTRWGQQNASIEFYKEYKNINNFTFANKNGITFNIKTKLIAPVYNISKVSVNTTIIFRLIFTDEPPLPEATNLLLEKAFEFFVPLLLIFVIFVAFKDTESKLLSILSIFLIILLFYLLEYLTIFSAILMIVIASIVMYIISKKESEE